MIGVSDTGCGIPKELLDKVFEPFFTTKEVGMGSGLGLSMVYGFVKQSRGHVRLDSEVGAGSSVRIYLPRSTHDAPSGCGEPPDGELRDAEWRRPGARRRDGAPGRGRRSRSGAWACRRSRTSAIACSRLPTGAPRCAARRRRGVARRSAVHRCRSARRNERPRARAARQSRGGRGCRSCSPAGIRAMQWRKVRRFIPMRACSRSPMRSSISRTRSVAPSTKAKAMSTRRRSPRIRPFPQRWG